MPSERPLRSLLFAPATSDRMITKALASDADAVILDIEDAVALREKAGARAKLARLLDEVGGEKPIVVRVNDAGTGMLEADLAAVVRGRLAWVLLPKAEDPGTVARVSGLIERYEGTNRVQGPVRLAAILESAAGILMAPQIARAGGRLGWLMFGAGDLTNDLGIPTANTGPHLLHGKMQTVLASRAAGLMAPIDTVFFDLQDDGGFRADCEQARALGFSGKAVIHPKQIVPANEVFTPAPEEIDRARRMVEAFTAAEAAGTGAIDFEGKLVDYAMVKNARKTLELAAALAAGGHG